MFHFFQKSEQKCFWNLGFETLAQSGAVQQCQKSKSYSKVPTIILNTVFTPIKSLTVNIFM